MSDREPKAKAFYTQAEFVGALEQMARIIGSTLGALNAMIHQAEAGVMSVELLEKSKRHYAESVAKLEKFFGPKYAHEMAHMKPTKPTEE